MKLRPIYMAWLALIAIYKQPQTDFDEVLTIGPDVIGIKTVDGNYTVTPEGTIDKAMWLNNFEAWPSDSQTHPVLGEMHDGFLTAAMDIYAVLRPKLIVAVSSGLSISFQGHSRGGALVDVLTVLCALDGIATTVLGLEPAKVGMQQYVDYAASKVADGTITVAGWTKNGIDPVPFVGEFMVTRALQELDSAPGGLDDLNIARWHESPAVWAGCQKLFAADAALGGG